MIYLVNIQADAESAHAALIAQGFVVTETGHKPIFTATVMSPPRWRGRAIYSAFFKVAETLGLGYVSVLSIDPHRGALIGPGATGQAFDPANFYLNDGVALDIAQGELK